MPCGLDARVIHNTSKHMKTRRSRVTFISVVGSRNVGKLEFLVSIPMLRPALSGVESELTR